ncbi:unnamed protein product [Cercopithifilaria johnstoni]|uniref:Uncharacterized protein n=1 Tax=Cercopithifilaria johnstoni TaxID=2874296 RepID=A0A8J2M435_9BILA|nr:unnamed protein product [Cercopithifilaria johnstoni]
MLLPSWRAFGQDRHDSAKMRRRGRFVGKGRKEAGRQDSSISIIRRLQKEGCMRRVPFRPPRHTGGGSGEINNGHTWQWQPQRPHVIRINSSQIRPLPLLALPTIDHPLPHSHAASHNCLTSVGVVAGRYWLRGTSRMDF